MSIEGHMIGDRRVEYQRMPPPTPETPAPRKIDAAIAVSLGGYLVGAALTVTGAALWLGLGAALLAAGLVTIVVAVLVGWGT